MTTMEDIEALVQAQGVAVYEGYAPTGAAVPYVVQRPLYLAGDVIALTGEVIDWDEQIALYCCGASVTAAYNLAKLVMLTLQGKRSGDSTFNTSMGYNGAQVEGHYESQVTAQLNSGGIA